MFFSTFMIAAGLLLADAPDTLQTAVVVADKGMIVSKSDTILISNQIDVTEALSRIPASIVGDMGGAAGLKSVNLRGLGSAHTAVYVDGVRVSNVQSGQTDLGMLDVSSCSDIVVDYAQNSLSFNTSKPEFGSGNFAGSIKFRGGSFGTYEPAARLDFKLSDKVYLSAISSGTFSKGNFKYGESSRRENNDISQIRAGVDVWGQMERGSWHTKAYFNGSERGTPGSIDWPSTDRQKDRNVFVQGVVENRFTSVYTLNASAKAAYDDLLYSSEWGSSRYQAGEFQLNTSHVFRVADWAVISVAADVQRDELKSTEYDAGRTSLTSAVTSAFRLPRFKADVSLEYSGTFDRGYRGINVLSPSADLRFVIADGLDIMAFGRRSYRVPTFNELYYPGFGNPDLKCEDAWLSSLGLQWRKNVSDWSVNAGADFFFDALKNKIVSAPSVEDPSLWFPYNIGKAVMYGTDLKAGTSFEKGDWTGSLSAAYTLQDTKDKTPDSASYDQQIPYVARHSVSIALNGSYKGFSLNFLWNLRNGRRDSYSEMPDYNTLDINIGKDIRFNKGHSIGLKLIARNITDARYELSSGYPMPGRAFYGGVEYNF
ncbi:MAG: TonB-dependent receptor [Bacteroidales bacterium]|nr:TonB-dependent receptor [Bacteroidales bacterium]